MRTSAVRLFSIVSMLALLFGSQLCMVVQCAPGKSTSQAHQCCAKGVAKSPANSTAPDRTASHEAAKPCCIQATTAAAPALQLPVANDLHALAAVLVAAQLVAAPAAAPGPSPPGDDPAPRTAPPLSAAGSRAPPLA